MTSKPSFCPSDAVDSKLGQKSPSTWSIWFIIQWKNASHWRFRQHWAKWTPSLLVNVLTFISNKKLGHYRWDVYWFSVADTYFFLRLYPSRPNRKQFRCASWLSSLYFSYVSRENKTVLNWSKVTWSRETIQCIGNGAMKMESLIQSWVLMRQQSYSFYSVQLYPIDGRSKKYKTRRYTAICLLATKQAVRSSRAYSSRNI